MESQKLIFQLWAFCLFFLNMLPASCAVCLCGPFKEHVRYWCNTSASFIIHYSNHLEIGAEIFHLYVFIYPFSINSLRWGPTRWESCRWDTLCGRGMAPTWSRCRIIGIWQWPRWRNGLLSLWRQWTLWLVHVSATRYHADDSPTGQRRKWCCNTFQHDHQRNTYTKKKFKSPPLNPLTECIPHQNIQISCVLIKNY